ncbi:transposase [Streptomyces javensis]
MSIWVALLSLSGCSQPYAGPCPETPGHLTEHVVDTAYVTPARIERARRRHGITLLGPVVVSPSHQARSKGGFGKSVFTIDWDTRQTCPQGATSRGWGPLNVKGHQYIQVRFDKTTCLACPVRAQCTTSATRPRALTLLPESLHEIRTRNRRDQGIGAWRQRYAIRARIDWKYALRLELLDSGFDHSVLCEFRARLTEQDGAADRLLEVMLERLVQAGLLKAGRRQRTHATHVLAAVRVRGVLMTPAESSSRWRPRCR